MYCYYTSPCLFMLRSNTPFLSLGCLLSNIINSRKDVIILLVLHHELPFRCSSAKLTNSYITAQVYYHIDVEHHQDFRLLPGTTCVRYQVILVIRGPTCFIPSCLATIQGCQDMSLGLGQLALSETYLPKWSEMIMIGCMWSSQYARFRSDFV